MYDQGVSRGVQQLWRVPLLSASQKRSQKKEASVNQHETEKDFLKHKYAQTAYPEQKLALQSVAFASVGQ